jgi:thiamine monophosphate synthase
VVRAITEADDPAAATRAFTRALRPDDTDRGAGGAL